MNTTTTDDAARRAYWTEQMDFGYDFVQKLIAFPDIVLWLPRSMR